MFCFFFPLPLRLPLLLSFFFGPSRDLFFTRVSNLFNWVRRIGVEHEPPDLLIGSEGPVYCRDGIKEDTRWRWYSTISIGRVCDIPVSIQYQSNLARSISCLPLDLINPTPTSRVHASLVSSATALHNGCPSHLLKCHHSLYPPYSLPFTTHITLALHSQPTSRSS